MDDADRLDLMRLVFCQSRLDRGGIDTVTPVAGNEFDFRPSRSASSHQSVANWPVSNISTRSPGDSMLTSAASHAPVPDDGKMTTSSFVLKMPFSASRTSLPSWPNSGPR